MICASAKLGRLDDQLAAAWLSRWSAANPAEQSVLLAEQRQWLANRNGISDARTIEALYLDRIHALRGSAALAMPLITGEYSFGSYQLPDPKEPLSLYNGPYYGSILVYDRSPQIHIEATGGAHSHTCGFGGTSTRREGNTFFFDDDKGLGEDAVPRLTFTPSHAEFEVSDSAARCGASAHLNDHYPRVRSRALSFPCHLATSAAERTICRTPALGALDLQLAALWEANPKRLSQEESMRATARRDRCGASIVCLTAWYRAELNRPR